MSVAMMEMFHVTVALQMVTMMFLTMLLLVDLHHRDSELTLLMVGMFVLLLLEQMGLRSLEHVHQVQELTVVLLEVQLDAHRRLLLAHHKGE
jgi:hypothetical protein